MKFFYFFCIALLTYLYYYGIYKVKGGEVHENPSYNALVIERKAYHGQGCKLRRACRDKGREKAMRRKEDIRKAHRASQRSTRIGGTAMKKNLKKIGDMVRVDGYGYRIQTAERDGMPEEIDLVPLGEGATASSYIGWDDYAYTHGGRIYRHAVERAKKLRDEIFVHQEA